MRANTWQNSAKGRAHRASRAKADKRARLGIHEWDAFDLERRRQGYADEYRRPGEQHWWRDQWDARHWYGGGWGHQRLAAAMAAHGIGGIQALGLTPEWAMAMAEECEDVDRALKVACHAA